MPHFWGDLPLKLQAFGSGAIALGVFDLQSEATAGEACKLLLCPVHVR